MAPIKPKTELQPTEFRTSFTESQKERVFFNSFTLVDYQKMTPTQKIISCGACALEDSATTPRNLFLIQPNFTQFDNITKNKMDVESTVNAVNTQFARVVKSSIAGNPKKVRIFNGSTQYVDKKSSSYKDAPLSIQQGEWVTTNPQYATSYAGIIGIKKGKATKNGTVRYTDLPLENLYVMDSKGPTDRDATFATKYKTGRRYQNGQTNYYTNFVYTPVRKESYTAINVPNSKAKDIQKLKAEWINRMEKNAEKLDDFQTKNAAFRPFTKEQVEIAQKQWNDFVIKINDSAILETDEFAKFKQTNSVAIGQFQASLEQQAEKFSASDAPLAAAALDKINQEKMKFASSNKKHKDDFYAYCVYKQHLINEFLGWGGTQKMVQEYDRINTPEHKLSVARIEKQQLIDNFNNLTINSKSKKEQLDKQISDLNIKYVEAKSKKEKILDSIKDLDKNFNAQKEKIQKDIDNLKALDKPIAKEITDNNKKIQELTKRKGEIDLNIKEKNSTVQQLSSSSQSTISADEEKIINIRESAQNSIEEHKKTKSLLENEKNTCSSQLEKGNMLAAILSTNEENAFVRAFNLKSKFFLAEKKLNEAYKQKKLYHFWNKKYWEFDHIMSTAAHDKNEASEEFKRMSPLDVKTANSIEIELGKYLQSNNIAQNVFEANTIPELTDMVKNANARANITITNLNNSINEENKSIVDIKTGADSQIKDIVNEQVSSMDDIEKNVAEQKQLQNEQQDLDQEISKLTLRNSELSKEHDQLTIQLKECSEEQKKISIECSVNTEKEKKELTLAKESAIKELNILGSQLFSLNAQSDAIVKEDKLAKEKFDKKNKDIDDEINEYEKMLNIKNEPKPTSSSIDEQSVLPSIITDQTTNSSKPNQDISLKEDESDLKVN